MAFRKQMRHVNGYRCVLRAEIKIYTVLYIDIDLREGYVYIFAAPKPIGRRVRKPGVDRKPRQAYSAKQLERLEAEFKVKFAIHDIKGLKKTCQCAT